MDVERLCVELEAVDERSRYRAALALMELARTDPRAAEPAVPALIGVIHDPNDEVRREAMWALGRIGPPASAAADELRRRLQQEELLACYCAAACALALIGEVDDALPELIKFFDDPGWDITFPWLICDVLANLGPAASPAVPALKRYITRNVRGEGVLPESRWDEVLAETLQAIEGETANPFFVELLDDPHRPIRWHAALSLSDETALSHDDVKELEAIVRCERTEDRGHLIAALRERFLPTDESSATFMATTTSCSPEPLPPDSPVFSLLLAALDDEDRSVRRHAASQLRKLRARGVDLVPYIPRLIELLADDHLVALDAQLTLSEMGAAAVPALIEACHHPNEHVRSEVILALKLMGREGHAAVPTLLNLIKKYRRSRQSRRADWYRNAEWAIIHIALPGDRAVCEYLAAKLSDSSPSKQEEILAYFAAAGAQAAPYLSEIRELLDHADESVRQAAENAVRQIAGSSDS